MSKETDKLVTNIINKKPEKETMENLKNILRKKVLNRIREQKDE